MTKTASQRVVFTREDALAFIGEACRNWEPELNLSEDDIQDVAIALSSAMKRKHQQELAASITEHGQENLKIMLSMTIDADGIRDSNYSDGLSYD